MAISKIESAGLGAGTVLQVVNATYSTFTTIQSTTFTDTGLTASITPKFSTSKILVIVNMQMTTYRATGNSVMGGAQLVRNSTTINTIERYVGMAAAVGAGADIFVACNAGIVYLDSPATTSSTTYKVQGKVSTTLNDGKIWVNDYSVSATPVSTITLMEIAV